MRFLVKNVPYTFLSLPFPLVPSSRGYRNKKRILQRSNLWIVVRLRFQQVAIEHVNEKRKGDTKKGRRSWKPKDVAPEGACWVKFSIRALKARGARINTRWQGEKVRRAYKFPARCRFLVITGQAKLPCPSSPAIFREQLEGGAHEIPRFLRYFAPKNTPVPSSCRTSSPPSSYGSPRGCFKLCKK